MSSLEEKRTLTGILRRAVGYRCGQATQLLTGADAAPYPQQHHQLGVSARILALLPPRKTLLRYRYRDLFLRWPLPSFSKSRKEPGRKASSLPWVEFPSCRQRGLWPKGRLPAHPYKPQSLNPPSAGGKECAESSTTPGGLSGLAQ